MYWVIQYDSEQIWLILIKIKLTKSENDYRQERMEDYPLEHKFDIGTMDLESKS